MSSVDRTYTNLLTHLQRPGSGIPLQTVLSAIPYYVVQLPLPHPTQFTAFIISSPLWQPPSVQSVSSLIAAYRSAVHLKEASLQKAPRGWFSAGPRALIAEWAHAVMKGVSRGDAQLKISILGGLLLGFDDLRLDGICHNIRESVEEQVVISCAEVLEAIPAPEDTWRSEFTVRETEDPEYAKDSLFLYSACHVLTPVASAKLAALDILGMIRLVETGIRTAFCSGEFLSQLSLSISHSGGQLVISSRSGLACSLRVMSKRTLYSDVGSLAKLLSRFLSLLADRTPLAAWHTFQDVCDHMELLTFQVEGDWKRSPLAALPSERDLESRTGELSTEIWNVLKTLFFTYLLVTQSILSSIPYLRPPEMPASKPNPSSIAYSILRSLHHLSFVVSQFGGVSSSAEGLNELKRVFYMAVDIIAVDPDSRASNVFVQEMISQVHDSQLDLTHPFQLSQAAYVLAVVEQLVPALNELVIEITVIPFCHLYLNDPRHRESYESAHSVMLSIFAAHARRKEKQGNMIRSNLPERLVPFYVDTLIKNATENRLSTAQLRLAYSSLVRALSGDDALAWFCIEALLVHLEASAQKPPSNRPLHLDLTLVSLIACTPLSLLPRVLAEVEKAFEDASGADKVELGKAILEEIMDKVGNREKELVLSWWCRVAKTSLASQVEDMV